MVNTWLNRLPAGGAYEVMDNTVVWDPRVVVFVKPKKVCKTPADLMGRVTQATPRSSTGNARGRMKTS